MEQKATIILFALLRSAVCGDTISSYEQSLFSPELLSELYSLSSKHDIAHLVGVGLEKNRLLDASTSQFTKDAVKALYRYQRLETDLSRLCAALEEAQIPFMPLKGSVLRKHYPEPWMRTSCDIDVLVHEQDVERAVSLLTKKYGYSSQGRDSHDYSLFSPIGNHIELHFDLVEEGLANLARSVLTTVWCSAALKHNCSYQYEMPDAIFYFYHIAHMAKHFEMGGCGIRPFIDLWILDHLPSADTIRRDSLLTQGNLLTFAQAARQLCNVWFAHSPMDAISQKMENYIISGGVYGTNLNRVVVQQQKTGGRLRYAITRIFLPYSSLKYTYPVLEKHPLLYPVIQVHRWFRILFQGRFRSAVNELRINHNVSQEQAEDMVNFLQDIGL